MVNKPQQSRSRTYAFTYFPDPSNIEMDCQRYFKHSISPWVNKGVKALFMGLEECPNSKKLHFQGFVRFNCAKTFRAVKQKIFQLDKIHIEVAKSSDAANRDYCLAYGKYLNKPGHLKRLIDFGKPAKQGKRNDITRAIEIISQTGKMSAVLDEVHNYQACRHTEMWLKYKEKPRPVDPKNMKVINIYGAAGTGKTKAVYDFCAPRIPYKPVSYKWWEGYDGDQIVLLDDIRGDFCKYHELLTLLDIYPFRVETKGGSRQIQATTIFITTPVPLVEIWSHRTAEDIKQLSRRITHTININEIDKLSSL